MLNGPEGRTYERFLELPAAVVVAVLWLVGAVLEGTGVLVLYLERVMNLIRNGLGMRKAGDHRGAGQPENPHSNTVFTQVHNTL